MAAAVRETGCCPVCSSNIQEYMIHMDTRMVMCDNVKCAFPFDQSPIEPYLETVPHASRRYGKHRYARSSVAKTSQPAADDRAQSANACGQLASSLPSQVALQTDIPPPSFPNAPAEQKPLMVIDDSFIQSPLPDSNTAIYTFDLNPAEMEELLSHGDIPSLDEDDSLRTPKDSSDLTWINSMDAILGHGASKLEMYPFNGDIDSFLGLR